MKPELSWSDQVPEREDRPRSNSIKDLCFSPDGSNLVVAVENRVLMYDGTDGELLHSLRGHKDVVYTVDYSKDGKHFASGGADRTVIIWTSKAEGVLKYTHNESIIRLAFSPGTTKLASCTQLDFGLWSREQKSVVKHKVHAKILSASWSSDGLHLALGFIDGHVSIRDVDGVEKVPITRGAPVWCLAWWPAAEEAEVLTVGCWDQTLSFYLLSGDASELMMLVNDIPDKSAGEEHTKDRKLGFNPCGISYINGGSYIAVGGSNRKATLYTKEGVRLSTVCETHAWIWAVSGRSGHDELAVGCDDGTIQVHKLRFRNVTAMYKDRYAYRDNMSDVIVQHIVSDQKVRIKCRDYVDKVAIFRDRLAVQLLGKVHIYELTHQDDKFDLRYRLKDKIYLPTATKTPPSVTPIEAVEHIGEGIEESKGAGSAGWEGRGGGGGRAAVSTGGCGNGESNFLLVTWNNVVLCEDNVLQLYDFAGIKIREWVLDAPILCARVDGGPSGGEALLLGLQNGAVLRVFVNNAFPVEVVKVSAPVVCCAMSLHRKKISVVDAKSRVMVFDVLSKELVFQEDGASSVAFSSSMENTMCYTGNGKLYVRTGSFPVQEQLIGGDVQSYQGSRVVFLEGVKLRMADVPLTNAMYRHLEAREFQQAYTVASLGVTQRDWEILGASALQALDFNTCRKAFTRLRDLHLVDLVSEIEAKAVYEADYSKNDSAVRTKLEADASAELMAHQGNYQAAAKTWARNGMVDKAISMFIELRQWDEAKVFAASSGGLISGQELTRRQAEWAEEIGDWGTASKLFVHCAEPLRAARLACKGRAEGWYDALAEIARSVPKTEVEVLSLCGKELSDAGHDDLAREAYLKMEDIPKVVALYVKSQMWSEAVKLSNEYRGKFDESVFLPYALWLRDQGEFDEALEAFHKAGRRDLSGAMTAELISNAVTKTRFDDASYYCWRSSKEAYAGAEDLDTNDKDRRRQTLARASEHSRLADLYHAYHHVNAFTTDPFTDLQPDVLLQASRFLVNSLGDGEPPKGISTAHTLYTLAKQAKVLGAFKLARFAYDRLQRQRVPPLWQDQIDLDMLTVQAKPVQDNPELFAACFRCGASNPLLSPFSAVSFNKGGQDGNPLPWGDACTSCRHPFVRSFFNFEVLPLVEFEPEPGIDDDKALELIRTTPPRGARHGRGGTLAQNWREVKRGSADVMAFDVDAGEVEGGASLSVEDEEGMITGDEIFNRCINATLEAQEERTSMSIYTPVVVGASCLRALRREDVFRVPPGTCGARSRFFKNMMPDIPLALSQPCGRFFHEEDFEFAHLREGRCPFSRVKDVGDYGSC